jgi:hypothetical protein
MSSGISRPEQVTGTYNEMRMISVLDQHAELEFYGASSLRQQCAGRHVTPHYTDS